MTWTKTKASVAMAVCAASVLIALGTLLLTSKQIAILRAENQKLQAEIAEGRQSAAEPPASALALTPELDRLKHDAAEVLRLRGEVASLRRDRSDLAKLTEENARLRQRLLAAANETKEDAERLTPEQEAAKQVGIAKLNFTRDWLAAFRAYAAWRRMGSMKTPKRLQPLIDEGLNEPVKVRPITTNRAVGIDG